MAKMIQIRHVPDEVHAALKARAAGAGLSLSDYLLREVERLAVAPDLREMLERMKRERPLLHLGSATADIIRESRDTGDW